jgi:hypothetical protein
MARKLEIDNLAYVKSHGTNPRGFGLWAFELVDGSCGRVVATVFAPHSSTLADAKKWLRNHVATTMAAELATGLLYASVAP